MKTTALTGLALLTLAANCVAPGYGRDPNTILNISPATNQRIIVTYVNEQSTTTFTAMIAVDEGEWFVEGKDGSKIDLPASAKDFVITGGASPVVKLDGKEVKIYALKKDVLGTKRYSIGGDVPQKDKFYLVINYLKSVITIEVKQKV